MVCVGHLDTGPSITLLVTQCETRMLIKCKWRWDFWMQEDEQPLMCYLCGVWMYPRQRWLMCLRGGLSAAECGFTWATVALDPTILTYWGIAHSMQWSKGPRPTVNTGCRIRAWATMSQQRSFHQFLKSRHTNTDGSVAWRLGKTMTPDSGAHGVM